MCVRSRKLLACHAFTCPAAVTGTPTAARSPPQRPPLLRADGGVQMEAPVNVWAQRRAARDGAEVAALEALVDRMASRQRAREARAAAVEAATEAGEDAAAAAAAGAAAAAEAAAGGAPVVAAEAAAAAAAWDDLMGEGYSEFMEEDGLVFYDDADEDADEDAD